jgi:DNA-binding HxlR family transcriptional regulator
MDTMLRTKRQKTTLCASCPFAKTANLIGDSVVLLIVRELLRGAKRFGDFEEAFAGVSTRTLSEKLKHLEDEKVITRKEYGGKPPRVEYSLTKKGAALSKIADAMITFGKKYLK